MITTFQALSLNVLNKRVNICLLQVGVGGSDALVSFIHHQAPADHVPI